MRRLAPALTLLASLLLLMGLIAACDGGGKAEPPASEPTTEASDATPTEDADGEPTTAPEGALPFDSLHYTVEMEFTVSEAGEEQSELMSLRVEGDFVAPDSHAFTNSFGFAGLSGTQDVVIIGDDAWLREGSGDWTATSRSDPDVLDTIDMSSADPDFLDLGDIADDLAALDSEAATVNGVETRRYHIPKEALETLSGLLGEDFLQDAAGLEEFEMTVWVEEETDTPIRFEFTATASPEVFGEDMGLGMSPDATVGVSMLIDITQIDDPDIEIEPPI